MLYALLVARGFRNATRFSTESLRAIGATQWIFDLLDRPASVRIARRRTVRNTGRISGRRTVRITGRDPEGRPPSA